MAMLKRSQWNPSLTDDVIMEAVERTMTENENPGFCLICGVEAEGCEPDARNYKCENCGAEQVFGAEELALCHRVTAGQIETVERVSQQIQPLLSGLGPQ